MRLLLIRHGQTPNNVAGALDTGFPGAGLTTLGHAQAEAIPAALAHEDVTGVYASVLVRTQLTAEPLARELGLEVEVRDGLEEIGAGENEMRTDEEAVRSYVDTVSAWGHGELDRLMPGGQDGRAFLARYDAALEAIAVTHAPDDTVAVFSHGAAIRLYTALRSEDVHAAEVIERRIANTGLAILEGAPATGFSLVTWHAEPLGGHNLLDAVAHDVTGESADEAIAEAE